jgi:hypothetical protein
MASAQSGEAQPGEAQPEGRLPIILRYPALEGPKPEYPNYRFDIPNAVIECLKAPEYLKAIGEDLRLRNPDDPATVAEYFGWYYPLSVFVQL